MRLEPFRQWHKLPDWKMEDLSGYLPNDVGAAAAGERDR
jgi:hypothetical protein